MGSHSNLICRWISQNGFIHVYECDWYFWVIITQNIFICYHLIGFSFIVQFRVNSRIVDCISMQILDWLWNFITTLFLKSILSINVILIYKRTSDCTYLLNKFLQSTKYLKFDKQGWPLTIITNANSQIGK